METSNISSQSFGSIQIKLKGATISQKKIAQALALEIENSKKYQELIHQYPNDMDIYIIPRASDITVSLIDPYSGMLIKKPENNIVFQAIIHVKNLRYEAVTTKVLEMYEKVANGTVARPSRPVFAYKKDTTDLAKIHPAKHNQIKELLESSIKKSKKTGIEAENEAFEELKATYPNINTDGEF